MSTVEDQIPISLLPPKPVDMDRIEGAVRELLLAIGQGEKEEVMANTPRRVAEFYAEFINPPYVDVDLPIKTFANPGVTDPIYVNDVQYVSVCEHHLAPYFGIAHVAYVPDERVVGYSKLKKALNYVARQPTLNERLAVTVADFIEENLQPKGVALVLRSLHTCIAMRANAPMEEVVTVSAFRGLYDRGTASVTLRSEFWQLVAASKASFVGA